MVLEFPKKVHFLKFYADLSKKSNLLKQFTYIQLKGLVKFFQKMVLFIMLYLTVSEILGFEVKELC